MNSGACVHKNWFQRNGLYEGPRFKVSTKGRDEYICALKKTGKVILTSDKFSPEELKFERTGYIAVFSIFDVRVEAGYLRFRFVERLANLQ
jgi:hypothetical protein